MNFVQIMLARNLVQDITPDVESLLQSGKQRAYIGFDPTAPSLTIGNYVQVMVLKRLQLAGHQPIILMGGATGLIGDPSGKDAERTLLDADVLEKNKNHQLDLLKKLIDFDDPETGALVVDNMDFYKDLNPIEFLRDVGKFLTVNYMQSKESVKNRIATGISFTEFSYQLLQAYDFYCLYEKHDCKLQFGGSDQWGNITAGVELIRKKVEKSHAGGMTIPLLLKSDGKKFGKSEQGNIWMDPVLTSPYAFYQFWLNGADQDVDQYFNYFSLQDVGAIQELKQAHEQEPHLRKMQHALAEELTSRIHGEGALLGAKAASEILFNRKASAEQLQHLDAAVLKTISDEIPSFEVESSVFEQPVNVVDLITEKTQILPSKGEARRAIQGNSIQINKIRITEHDHLVKQEDLLHDKYLMIENGKKNKFMLVVK